MLTISGYVKTLQANGTPAAQATPKPVILQPSRADFHWTGDGGTTWQQWEGDPDLEDTYPGGISVAPNTSTGAYAFKVPYTDTEVQFPAATTSPGLQWNITDPNPTTGPVTYYGVCTGTLGIDTATTLKALIAGTWKIGSTQFTGYPYGNRRMTSVSFTSAGDTASASWSDIGSSAWKITGWGVRTDDTGVFMPNVVSGSETSTGCSIRISALPASGKTVIFDLTVEVP